MMAPAGVYADWEGVILDEKRAGQAAEAGWADGNGNFVGQFLQFEGHGVVHVALYNAAGVIIENTVHGSARLTVDTVGEDVFLEDCDHEFSSPCPPSTNDIRITNLSPGEMIIVDLKGAFQQMNAPNTGTQRGTLTLEITPVLP